MNVRLIFDDMKLIKMVSIKNVLTATLLMSGTVITIGVIAAMTGNALFAGDLDPQVNTTSEVIGAD
jgi:hypothetical protein